MITSVSLTYQNLSDIHFERAIAAERAELLARLIVDARCSEKDKDIAIGWISEILGKTM